MAINQIPPELRTPKRDRAFWARIDVQGDDDCWLWKSEVQLTQTGYGTAFYGPFHTTANRIAYMLGKGPIPDDAQILHTCEARYPVGSKTGRRCCNPNHLYAGSPQDNMDDKVRNERQWRSQWYRGDRNPNARLSGDQLPQLFEDAKTMSQRKLAAKYGISKSQVGNLLRGESRVGTVSRLGKRLRTDAAEASASRAKR
jgi:hypothetical protein